MNKEHFFCPVCHNRAQEFMTPCSSCRDKILQENHEKCLLCARSLAGSDNPCPDCRIRNTAIDGIRALGMWHGPLREWLSELKYGGDSRMAGWLAGELSALYRMYWDGLTIVPVPPRFRRLFENGIDPVGLLARGLKKENVPVEHLLYRKGRGTQKSLSRNERIAGSHLKYRLKRKNGIQGVAYVILDDISTTGATLNACAEILKAAGATGVFGLVVCKD
jgi:ComF family protein